jgi:hypothetical protein
MMWKEAVAAKIDVVSRNLAGGTREITPTLIKLVGILAEI